MKKLLISTALFCLLSSSLTFASNTACWQHPMFVTALNDKQAKAVFNSLSKEDQKKVLTGDGDAIGSMNIESVYEADINNDGKAEIIFVLRDDGAIDPPPLAAAIFQKDTSGYKYLGDIPDPYDGGWCSDRYFDHNKQDNFLTQICGKTYISCLNTSDNDFPVRDTFIVKNNKNDDACDGDWLGYERQSFQTLYNQHSYDQAYAQLNFYTNKCKTQISPQVYLSIQNDLALAALKGNHLALCKETINNIENAPSFSQALPTLKKAVAFNKNLCEQKSRQPSTSNTPLDKTQLSWLLATKLPIKEFNDHLKDLIPKIAPASIEDGQLNSTLNQHLIYPVDSGTKSLTIDDTGVREIVDNRYVMLSAAVTRYEVCFAWIDTQTGRSVVGTYDQDVVQIASSNYSAHTVPLAAKTAIAELAKQAATRYSKPNQEADFYDIKSKSYFRMKDDWLFSKKAGDN